MSNDLIIAAVTASLRDIVANAIVGSAPGAVVSTLAPTETGQNLGETRVNIFMYQAIPDGMLSNQYLPSRRTDGSLIADAPIALTLHYLVTFFGDAATQEPQRLLGRVATALYHQPLITRERLQETVETALLDDPDHYLGRLELDPRQQPLRLTPSALSLDDVTRIWSVFFQTPYILSLAYDCRTVFLEPGEAPKPALPVRSRGAETVFFKNPEISKAAASEDPATPDDFYLVGRDMVDDEVAVFVGDLEAVQSSASENRIEASLPAGTAAGLHPVQVRCRRLIGEPPQPRPSGESNLATLAVRPRIDEASVAIDLNDQDEPELSLTAAPPVGADQRVVLLLNELNGGPAYALTALARAAEADPLRFSLADVAEGRCLLRLRVDGAESLLAVDGAGVYNAPAVDIVIPTPEPERRRERGTRRGRGRGPR